MDSLGGADLRFRSPQSDISLYCKTTDTRASVSHGMSVYFPTKAGPHFTDPGGQKRQKANKWIK